MSKIIFIDTSIEYSDFLIENIRNDVTYIDLGNGDDIDLTTRLINDDISWNTVTNVAFIYDNNLFFPFTFDFLIICIILAKVLKKY